MDFCVTHAGNPALRGPTARAAPADATLVALGMP